MMVLLHGISYKPRGAKHPAAKLGLLRKKRDTTFIVAHGIVPLLTPLFYVKRTAFLLLPLLAADIPWKQQRLLKGEAPDSSLRW